MKKNAFSILHDLDLDTRKTHISHTKKIKRICNTLKIVQETTSEILFVVQPPTIDDSFDENLRIVIYTRCMLVDPNTKMFCSFTILIRCKEKATSRNTINCYTMTMVQDCVNKGHKIYDITVDLDKNTNYVYSRHVLDVIGNYVWNFFKSHLETLKSHIKGRRSGFYLTTWDI